MNNYPKNLVRTLIRKQSFMVRQHDEQQQQPLSQRTRRKAAEVEVPKEGPKHYVGLRYVHSLSENIGKMFKDNNVDIQIAHSVGNNLNMLYNQQKNKKEKLDAINSVYKIECQGKALEKCDQSYIGTSSRKLRTRMNEHNNDQNKLVLPQNHTALCEHALYNDHRFCTSKPKVLDVEHNYSKRMLKESFYIYSTKHTVNFRQDTEGVNRIYKNVLLDCP